jgi:RNA polymerase sigma-70 factor (ECF subfamily)
MKETESNSKRLSRFFESEYRNIRNFVRRRIKDSSERDAEDIIQDVALNLFAKADFSSVINDAAAYVYGALKNKIIDTMRTRKQNYHYQDEENAYYQNRLLADFEAEFTKTGDQLSDENIKILYSEINKLKPKYRDIITATEIEGITFREISENTRTPIGTLLARKHRALANLNKSLSQKFDWIQT